jgi:lysozyme
MQMTDEGLALIKRFEGFRSRAYRDPVGVWTIGYGHTAMAGPPSVSEGLEVSRAEADAILRRDVEQFARDVAASLRVALAPARFSALVSFAYNVGIGNFRASSVLKAVNAGDFAAVARRLQLWTKAGGRVLPGLIKRRAAEAELFLSPAADAEVPPGTPVEAIEGKPAHRSTTNLAAIISALAGIASTLLASAREAGDVLGGPLPGLLVMAVMVGAALWILRERRLKAKEEGI